MEPRFFATPADFRAWLEAQHQTAPELLVGFYKKSSGLPSLTWPESVDQALCFGWIDGVRRRLDETSYAIRFTPRRTRSIWSEVNRKRFGELAAAGLVQPAGQRAFEQRVAERTGVYSYERAEHGVLDAAAERAFRADAAAWAYWEARPAWYRRAAAHCVGSAVREATRQKRLATLIGDSAAGRTIAPLTRDERTRPA